MGHVNALRLSDRAVQLAAFLATRSTPTQALPASEVATIIGSRRHAPAVILELQVAGLVHSVKNFLLPCDAILEFTAQYAGGAGATVETSVAATQADALAPNAAVSTPSALSTAQPEDLRTRQRDLILASGSFNARSARRVSSFPEGEAYETSNPVTDSVSDTNNYLYNNIHIPAPVRSEDRASVGNQPGTAEIENRIYSNSRNRKRIYADSGVVYTPPARVDRQAMAKMRAKRVAAGHTTGIVTIALADEAEAVRAYGVAVAYEELLGVYLGKPTLRYLKGRVAPGQPNYANWARAASVADELGMDYATFVRSQFWAFDAWYNRPPKPQELGSRGGAQSSGERARQYLEAIAAGTVTAGGNILGKQRQIVDTTTSRGRAAVKVDSSVKFRHSEQQLRALMRNYDVDEEQALRTFAKGATAYVYFDRDWLKQNQTYQRLVAAGEI